MCKNRIYVSSNRCYIYFSHSVGIFLRHIKCFFSWKLSSVWTLQQFCFFSPSCTIYLLTLFGWFLNGKCIGRNFWWLIFEHGNIGLVDVSWKKRPQELMLRTALLVCLVMMALAMRVNDGAMSGQSMAATKFQHDVKEDADRSWCDTCDPAWEQKKFRKVFFLSCQGVKGKSKNIWNSGTLRIPRERWGNPRKH